MSEKPKYKTAAIPPLFALGIVLIAVLGFSGTGVFLSHGMRNAPHPPGYLRLTDTAGTDTVLLQVLPGDSLYASHVAAPKPGATIVNAPLNDMLFNRDPALLVWVNLVSVMVAFALASLLLFGGAIFRSKTLGLSWGHIGLRIVFSLLVCAFMVALPLFSWNIWDLQEMIEALRIVLVNPRSINWPIYLTVLPAVFGIAALFCIGARAAAIANSFRESPGSVSDHRAELKELGTMMQSLLGLLAVLVTFSVLTTGALRIAALGLVHVRGLDIFPLDFVRIYGFFFSTFLAMTYIPMYIQVKSVHALLGPEPTASAPGTPGAKPDVWSATPWDQIKAGIAVLLPLIGSFLPDQIKHLMG